MLCPKVKVFLLPNFYMQKDIANNRTIAVVGLGYVGLPLALLAERKGYKVIGIDVSSEKMELLNKRVAPFADQEIAEQLKNSSLEATMDFSKIKDASVIIICVPTPIHKNHMPNLEPVENACRSIASFLQKEQLVILESTVNPGICENIILSILEKESGLIVNKDFYLGHCPERVMPGKLLNNLQNYHRVVGGFDKETAEAMRDLYKTYVKGDLDLSDLTTAEVVKTTENYYRDVEIAFANQLALLCEELGVNVYEARKLINKVEDRNVHMPGAGVGGHCIPKDGLLNVSVIRSKKNSDAEVAVKMADLAREINDFMPIHMISLLKKGLEKAGRKLDRSKIAVLGYSYLANSDDTRNSPTKTLLEKLNGSKVVVHDPFVEKYKGSLDVVLKNAGAAVFMVAHDEYKNLSLEKLKKLMRTKILIDGRNIFSKDEAKKLGFIYKGIGNV